MSFRDAEFVGYVRELHPQCVAHGYDRSFTLRQTTVDDFPDGLVDLVTVVISVTVVDFGLGLFDRQAVAAFACRRRRSLINVDVSISDAMSVLLSLRRTFLFFVTNLWKNF